MIDPVTFAVYKIPTESVVYAGPHVIELQFATFEETACTNGFGLDCVLKARRLVDPSPTPPTAIVILKLKPHDGGAARYLWTSRMTTTIPETLKTIDPSLSREMGREFLWSWPSAQAFNEWATRRNTREQLASNAAAFPPNTHFVDHEIDVFPPDVGAEVRPASIDGATRVSEASLTPVQRLFTSCVYPQDSLYPRRAPSSNKESKLAEHQDRRQARMPERVYRITGENEHALTVEKREECIRKVLEVNGTVASNTGKRHANAELAQGDATPSAHESQKRTRRKTVQKEKIEPRTWMCVRDAIVATASATHHGSSDARGFERLPIEMRQHIFGHATANAMTSNVATCQSGLKTLLLLNKV